MKMRAWDPQKEVMQYLRESDRMPEAVHWQFFQDGSFAMVDYHEKLIGASCDGWIPLLWSTMGDDAGEPLYEGDIIQVDNGGLHVLYFWNGVFGLLTSSGMIIMPLQGFTSRKLKGNIFQNSDMIEHRELNKWHAMQEIKESYHAA